MRKVGVALLGLGVVGGGTYKTITEHREYYQRTQNLDLVVESVLERDEEKIKALGVEKERVASNIAEVVMNPDVNIVVECIGGTEAAREYVLAALCAGKTVVTSNKLLYAKHSEELERAAKRHNAGLHLEASCMGGVPIVRTLMSELQANVITSFVGIVNGTTNYILSELSEQNGTFQEILERVHKLGIAEADEEYDLEGYDAVYKLSILSALSFHMRVPVEKIYREGITGITEEDFRSARDLGYCIKLLAIGKLRDDGVEVRVHPALVPKEHPLAGINGSYNAMFLTGDCVGDVLLSGKGAGALPSGSAIVSDVLFAANHYEDISTAFKRPYTQDKSAKIISDFSGNYFLRLKIGKGNQAKVLSLISQKGISIKKLVHETCECGEKLLLITHETRESAIKATVQKIAERNLVSVESLLRVI